MILRACSLIALLAAPAAAQVPFISEAQSVNRTTLLDEDGEAPDWIEVTNPGTSDYDISGWHLSDNDDALDAWAFPPGTVIPAQGSIIVFASHKNRAIAGAPLHTDFRLSGEGETVYLVFSNGSTVVSELEMPRGYTNVSYGRDPAGALTYFVSPTPGLPNGTGAPVVLNPRHAPTTPKAGEPVVVTALVPDPFGATASATLTYRVMYGTEQSVVMVDDGSGDDKIAGDRIWTGTIPPVAAPGEMLRWKLTVSDSSDGSSFTLPPHAKPKFSDEYLGTRIADGNVQTQLPVWWWFIENPGQANQVAGSRCSVSYAGEFYDNVYVRIRGGSSYAYPKKSYKFDFNPEHRVRIDIDGPRHDEININTTWADKAFIRQPLAYQLYSEAGGAAPISFPIRVEQNGTFFSVAVFIEEPGERAFLDRHGLDREGDMYKMYNTFTNWKGGSVEKKTRQYEGNGGLKIIINKLDKTGTELRDVLFDKVDVAACINYLAVTSLMHDNDHIAKNYFVHRETEGDREWRMLAWDKDLVWGRNYSLQGGVLNDKIYADDDPLAHPLFGDSDHPKNDGPFNKLIDRIYDTPETREMYLCHLRTLMDRFLQTETIPREERWIESKVDAWIAQMSPDVALDQAKWGIPFWGKDFTFRQDLDRFLQKYVRRRRFHLYETHAAKNGGIIPPANPSPAVMISLVEGDPISGDQDEEFVELTNTGSLAGDLSGWTLSGDIEFTFPAGAVCRAGSTLYISPDVYTFRQRSSSPTSGEGHFVVGPYSGHIKKGEIIELRNLEGELVDRIQY